MMFVLSAVVVLTVIPKIASVRYISSLRLCFVLPNNLCSSMNILTCLLSNLRSITLKVNYQGADIYGPFKWIKQILNCLTI